MTPLPARSGCCERAPAERKRIAIYQMVRDRVHRQSITRPHGRDDRQACAQAIDAARAPMPEKKYAANEEVQQPPWVDIGDNSGSLKKSVKIDNSDYHFTADPTYDFDEHQQLFRQNDLSRPLDLEFGSGKFHDKSINNRGHAGKVLSHAVHALHELLQYRPAAVMFTAIEPSRQKAVPSSRRRFNRDTKKLTGGEYEGLLLPNDDFAQGHRYAIVHRAMRNVPHFQSGESMHLQSGEPIKYAASDEPGAYELQDPHPMDEQFTESRF